MTEKKRPAPQVPEDVRQKVTGAYGRVVLNGLGVDVRVNDVRARYGHLDYLVSPMAGDGKKWVQSDRVSLNS